MVHQQLRIPLEDVGRRQVQGNRIAKAMRQHRPPIVECKPAADAYISFRRCFPPQAFGAHRPRDENNAESEPLVRSVAEECYQQRQPDAVKVFEIDKISARNGIGITPIREPDQDHHHHRDQNPRLQRTRS